MVKKFLGLLIFLVAFSLLEAFPPSSTLLTIDKDSPSKHEVIREVLALQKSLIVSLAEPIPEEFVKTGFLLVPMTPEYVDHLLKDKEGRILCAFLDETLVGYILLTDTSEFTELYQNASVGRFETPIELEILNDWLEDPEVGYVEQIAVQPGYSRMGIGSALITKGKELKPGGLIADVFIYPVENEPSRLFFGSVGFEPSGILYQYPTANVNFPYAHRTEVFFWNFWGR